MQKYLHLSDQDISLNSKLKKEEIEELNLAGDPDKSPDGGSGDMGMHMPGGSSSKRDEYDASFFGRESLEDIIPNITEDLKERIIKAVNGRKYKKKKRKSEEE